MNILLVGYGRMGQLVGQLAESYDCKVAGIVDPASASSSGTIDHPRWRDAVDVAIDFSLPDAVPMNLPALARLHAGPFFSARLCTIGRAG